MLQVARLSLNQLGPSAESVEAFVRSRLHPAGGFVDRAGKPDLYYTVFGIDCLVALHQQPPIEAIVPFLRTFGLGDELDLLHLTCLARCWSAVDPRNLDPALAEAVRRRLAQHRKPEGGYHVDRDASHGSAYGCFVAAGALQDIGDPQPDADGVRRCLDGLATDDGGYSNEPAAGLGNTPATAAALTLQHQLQLPVREAAARFLFSCYHAEGGFFAVPGAPMPDLLSTAVALHALSAVKQPLGGVRDATLDFIDTLWTSRGSFFGHWAEEEDALDVEYTWYGLLALGHLSL